MKRAEAYFSRAYASFARDFLAFLCTLLCLVFAAGLAPALAAPPQRFALEEPGLHAEGGNLDIQLGVSVDNPDGLRDMLRDGAIMELTILARLQRLRSFWSNKDIAEKELHALLRHNPVTREFSLTMPGGESYIVDTNLQRLLSATWRKIAFSFGSLGILAEEEPESEYRIVLEFSLRHTEVPPWLANTFYFWSWDVVEPEERVIEFIF